MNGTRAAAQFADVFDEVTVFSRSMGARAPLETELANGDQDASVVQVPLREPLRSVASFYLNRLTIVALAFGVTIRLQQFLFRRSLWLDEALLASNIVRRSYGDLLQPLDLQQAAPIGFLWLQRTAIELFGNSEYALRLVPLLFGLASLALFVRLARRVLSTRVLPIAVIIFVLSPLLTYYSNEAKQYIGDVFAMLLVLNSAFDVQRAPRITARSWLTLTAVGAIAVWISHPAVLVLAGIGSLLLCSRVRRREWKNAFAIGSAGVIWLCSFASVWGYNKRSVDAYPAFKEYWKAGFAPEEASIGDRFSWLAGRFTDLISSDLGVSLTAIALTLCGIGAVALVLRRRGFQLAMLISPIPFLILAAGAQMYPFQGRLVLFLVPTVVLLLVSALEWPGRIGRRAILAGVSIGLAIACVAPASETIGTYLQPRSFNEARPVFQYVASQWQPGDQLYVQGAGGGAYEYYGPLFHLKASGFLFPRSDTPCDLHKGLRPLTRATRVWLVFAHRMSTRPANEREIFLSMMRVVSRPLAGFTANGAAAYLFDPHAQAPDPDGALVIKDPSTLCAGIRDRWFSVPAETRQKEAASPP